MHMTQRANKEWLEGREATDLLSKKNKRPIHEGVVRDLAAKGKIRKKLKPGYRRVNVYFRHDIEGLHPMRQLRRSKAEKPEGGPGAQ